MEVSNEKYIIDVPRIKVIGIKIITRRSERGRCCLPWMSAQKALTCPLSAGGDERGTGRNSI